ncbi:site-specific integrase [Salibacterium halotolerans]|uniref:Phage integrase family protein n=1 Tax=Salibacterium halotolerans TaxID=1884432 RepID=A0A1I5MNT5_9BACI|nr:site-specific integrase [Salibacterium halotolerans]SFP10601.1 Phage integrase family protein [Salibacterium halotolerans]
MNYVQPIRDPAKIEMMKEYLKEKNERDYVLFVLGINTGLRISDILNLQVKHIQGHYIRIMEQKTRKQKRIRITPELFPYLKEYMRNMQHDDYLFQSRKGRNKPIQRSAAYRVLREAADYAGQGEVGTHTLRKTFGYHFYKQKKDVAMLQELFNHSYPSTTLKYIGVNQDAMDNAMSSFKIPTGL